MKGDPEQLIQGLSLRFFGVLGLVAALLLVDQSVFQPLLIRLNGSGPVINLAGRQRMLSQRMAKSVLALNHSPDLVEERVDELRNSLANWLEVHEGLQFGNADLNLPGTQLESIRQAFSRLDPHVQGMKAITEKVVRHAAASDNDVEVMLTHEQEFLSGMDDIVGMFEADAASQVTRLRWLGMIATMLVLVLMLGLARLVVQPASDYIRTQVQTITASEEKFRLLVESMNDGLAVFDSSGRIKYVNRRFSQILNRASDELIGLPLQKLLSGKDLQAFLQLLSHVHPQPESACELKWRLPDGELRITLSSFGTTEIHREENGLSFLVVTDITEIKRAEEELRQSRDRLEVRVAERTQELTLTNAALASEVMDRQAAEERNLLLQAELAQAIRVSTLGRFATGIAHEINQPLGAIANYSDALSLQIESGELSPGLLLKTCQRIHNSALRAGEIIRRMRSFLKTRPVQKSAELMNSLVEEVLELCSPEIRLNHVEVRCDLSASENMLVRVDPIQIQQVLVNLVQNALQAMAGSEDSRILTIRSEHNGDDIFIFVEDNGPGFSESVLTSELLQIQSTKPEGLGMGLSISHALISAHGGDLWIENAFPQGAQVGFSLTTIGITDSHVHSDHICR